MLIHQTTGNKHNGPNVKGVLLKIKYAIEILTEGT